MLTADAADSMAVELLIAVNPDGDSRLPYLLRIPQPGGDGHPGRKRNLLASMMRHRFRSALPVLPPRVMRSPHAQISRICGRFSLG
jgi:hypothetical protein